MLSRVANSSVRAGTRGMATAPATKPNPKFGSGPCKKRPGWTPAAYANAATGRSHRSKLGKGKLSQAIEETKELLGVPADFRVGIVPASDTGAVEMAMWSTLGPRNVDVCHWESFGKEWFSDATAQLGMQDKVIEHTVSAYGQLPDLSKVDSINNDVIFTWNGTTSGVKVPNADFISPDRKGIVINDATSAVFAMDVEWDKVDITTYSWQKVMGGEGAHGMMVLSPHAVERLESGPPVESGRPMPKIFRMVKKGKLDEALFQGSTINTPSLIAVEDYLDSMAWARSIGGLPALIQRSSNNLAVVADFVERNEWAHFLAVDPATRSNTSICLTLDLENAKLKEMLGWMEAEDIAYDIGAYRDAPPGIRIWGGATVESEDLELLCEWLEYGYSKYA